MTAVFTVSDPVLEKTYTPEKLKSQFLEFLQTNNKAETLNLYEVEYKNLPNEVQKSYDAIDATHFIKR